MQKRTIALLVCSAGALFIAVALMKAHEAREGAQKSELSAAVGDAPVETAPKAASWARADKVAPSAETRNSRTPKLVHSANEAVPDGNYAELLPALKQKADRGDAVAAYQIFSVLEDCKRMFRGYDDAATNKKRLEKCNGVTQDQLDASVQWLQKAADGGSAEAMGHYPLYGSLDLTVTEAIRDPQAIQDYKDRSKRYLETLAAACSPAAMLQLANDYFHGIMLPQNFQLAYAYALASALAIGAPESNDFNTTMYSQTFTQAQLATAKQTGLRLYAANCPNGPAGYPQADEGSE